MRWPVFCFLFLLLPCPARVSLFFVSSALPHVSACVHRAGRKGKRVPANRRHRACFICEGGDRGRDRQAEELIRQLAGATGRAGGGGGCQKPRKRRGVNRLPRQLSGGRYRTREHRKKVRSLLAGPGALFNGSFAFAPPNAPSGRRRRTGRAPTVATKKKNGARGSCLGETVTVETRWHYSWL